MNPQGIALLQGMIFFLAPLGVICAGLWRLAVSQKAIQQWFGHRIVISLM